MFQKIKNFWSKYKVWIKLILAIIIIAIIALFVKNLIMQLITGIMTLLFGASVLKDESDKLNTIKEREKILNEKAHNIISDLDNHGKKFIK